MHGQGPQSREDRDTSAGTGLLDLLEFRSSVRFIKSFVEPIKSWVSGVQTESSIAVCLSLSRNVRVYIRIVTQMKMESVLLEVREVRAHLNEKLRGIIVSTTIELSVHISMHTMRKRSILQKHHECPIQVHQLLFPSSAARLYSKFLAEGWSWFPTKHQGG